MPILLEESFVLRLFGGGGGIPFREGGKASADGDEFRTWLSEPVGLFGYSCLLGLLVIATGVVAGRVVLLE